MNFLTSTLGRALLSLPFFAFGIGHFANAGAMAGMVPSYVPGGVLWVYLTGAALLAAGLSFNIRKFDRLAGLLAALLMVVFAVTVHLPGMTKAVDPADTLANAFKMMSTGNFFKDLALAGGSLLLAGSSKGKA